MTPLETQLLELLERDSRASISQLAEDTGTTRRRVKDTIGRMMDVGIIKRFTVERGPASDPMADRNKTIFNVRLKGPNCSQLFRDIQTSDSFSIAWSVSSSETDMLIMAEASSMNDIEQLRNQIARNPLVHSMHTFGVLATWEKPHQATD